jgi:tRNA nucleotidyltransferase (CCA-adding enzyme)
MIPLREWLTRALIGDDPRAATARSARRLETIAWPAGTLEVLERLRAAGGQAYLVGGTVRDALLGREAHATIDVATDRTPEEVLARFARVEPVGIRHGTVLILEGALQVECTTFRRESGYADARHPDQVMFTRDPIEDLARRDLTVNAMAWDPSARSLLDPHAGALDLERRILRAVGDPERRFREDALRPLRVARLAATLGMAPEPDTRAALGRVLDRARRIAWERVGQELDRMMRAPRPSVGFELLREADLLGLWLPELARCVGVPQNRWHAFDVYEHSIRVCDAAPADKPRVRWAALFHDIGKPDTRVERDGEGTFYQHQFVGAELADRALRRLRHPASEREAIVHLVREHMFEFRSAWTDAALRRWLRRVGIDAVADLFDLRIADALGKTEHAVFPADLERMRARIEQLLAASTALEVADLEVDGRDVMRALGLPPGPEVGRVLESLLREVLEHPERNQRERLLARLDALRIGASS